RLIEDKVGPLEDSLPVVRTGTRLSGVAAAPSFDEALDRAVELAGRRAGDDVALVVTIDHAVNAEGAARAAELMEKRWKVARLVTTELSPTFGSQLGPGSVGIGVAPFV